MKCIIVDNDIDSVNILKDYISRLDCMELVAVCKTGFEAINAIKEHKIDLVFTEIEMPSFTGIDIVNSISSKNVAFVFTTFHAHYAIEAFNLGTVDYLMKPISFHRFMKSVNRSEELLDRREPNQEEIKKKCPSFIFVKSDYENVKIDLDEIKYIESMKDYVKIFTSREKTILTLGSLKSFEEKLNKRRFVRVHKSYIVAVDHIYSVQRNRIVIEDKRIPLGANYKDNFLRAIEA